MRVFRFVLSVALLAAVCAEVAPEIQEGLNTASDIVDKVAPLVTPQDTTPTANTAATPEAPLDASDIAGTTATVINQVANSDLVKESDAAPIVDTIADQATKIAGEDAATTSGAGSATTTSATPALDAGITAATQSSNTGLNIAGQIGQMAKQSGLINTDQLAAIKAQNPEFGALLGGLKNGAAIATGISQCSASIEGNEDQITSSFTSLGASMVNSDTITGVAALGETLFKAAALSTGQEDAMYQLFRIYLDQNANTGKALTTTQEKAYANLTPECNAAFDDIVTTYNDGKGTVSSLMAGSNTNVTCSNFQSPDKAVDMTLCVWPTSIWADENVGDKIYANVSATFTNYGVGLCDVSFYVINLDKKIAATPAWLPDSKTAFPDGIPQGKEIAIEATVPWTKDIANDAAIVDILKGWTACPNGRATAAPTAARTERAKPDTSVIDSAANCFLTDACQAAVAPFAADQCGAYAQLLSSGCSTCSADILAQYQQSCLKTCSTQYCGNPAADKVTSGASTLSKAVAFAVTLAAAFFAL